MGKRKRGEPVAGLPTLNARFAGLSAVLPHLWPVPTLGGTEAETAGDSADNSGPRCLTAEELFPSSPVAIPWISRDPDGAGGLVADGDTFMLAGDSGTGKTWILLHVLLTLAGRLALFDHFLIDRPRRVVLVDEESSLWLLQQRLPLLLTGLGLGRERFMDEIWPNIRIYADQGFSFESERAVGRLGEAATAFGAEVMLFDSFSRVHRRPENDNSAIAALFEERVKPFRRQVNASLGFSHHVRKLAKDQSNEAGQMVRGASDLKAQLDQLWFLRAGANSPKAIFEHAKCRPAPALKSFTLIREPMEDSGVRLRYAESTVGAGGLLEQAMDVIERHVVDNGAMSRQAILTFCKGRGIGERTMNSALGSLLDAERIVKMKQGKEAFYGPAPDWE